MESNAGPQQWYSTRLTLTLGGGLKVSKVIR